jgi:lipopolysaccharide/colanic/teichoic acid biosynthesis glycosyltransferase
MVHQERSFELRWDSESASTTEPELTVRHIDPSHDEPEVHHDSIEIEIDLDSITGTGFLRSIDRPLKRAVDIILSALVLGVASPLLLVIWVVIRTTSTGPAIFSHRRIGAGGVYFDCYKFRTMVQNADELLDKVLSEDEDLREEYARMHKLTDDPRITSIGKLLRKTSLDEFPQFWNVLKGDMSIVGPRPIVDEEVKRYGRWLSLVLLYRPGITGLWQVSGRNDTTYAERVALDRRYVLTRNLATDLSIILRTPAVMVKRNGAY